MDDGLRRILRCVALGLPIGVGAVSGLGGATVLLGCGCPSAQPTYITERATAQPGEESSGDEAVALTCEAICSEAHGRALDSCRLIGPREAECVYLDRTSMTRCVAGRLPESRATRVASAASSTRSAWLIETATLEVAAVAAFRELASSLELHEAPLALTRRAHRSAEDEVRHARSMTALAAREQGHAHVRVIARQRVEPSLEALAAHNAAEGCVREAHAALLAHWQAAHATDAAIRGAMRDIARDEARHALLSLDIDAWAHARFDASARRRVASARAEAQSELLASAASARADEALGLPTGAVSVRLARLVA